ncbi:MAG: tRNA pseudouridine(13) synthase TruD, partial [Planctomycetes bacterium]|nr:tRNA pseudouridine(13) synthase TruD [Planctomycetota bacterium]
NWRALREIAGRFGKHHSVFDHLRNEPGDFAGAFKHISTRERVIHQFAFQSHLWNRALDLWLKDAVPEPKRFTLPGIEGPLTFVKGPIPIELGWEGCLPLPGVHLEGCRDEKQVHFFEKALERYRLDGAGFEIADVPGFAFKADDRPLAIQPQNLRARPAEPDVLNEGYSSVKFSFELPRGAYASLLIKRLLGVQSNADQGYDPRRTSQVGQPRYDERDHGGGEGRGFRRRRGRGRGGRGERRDWSEGGGQDDRGGAPRRGRGARRGFAEDPGDFRPGPRRRGASRGRGRRGGPDRRPDGPPPGDGGYKRPF